MKNLLVLLLICIGCKDDKPPVNNRFLIGINGHVLVCAGINFNSGKFLTLTDCKDIETGQSSYDINNPTNFVIIPEPESK